MRRECSSVGNSWMVKIVAMKYPPRLELIDFITSLYDFYDTDEEEGEVEDGNKNGV